MNEFISEPLTPLKGARDTAAMGSGEPGLPEGFTWRGTSFTVARKLEQWKQSVPYNGRPGGERYLRRHYYRLTMGDGTVWTVYFVRQTPRSGSAKQRWFLYTIDPA